MSKYIKKRKPFNERFWSRVDKNGPTQPHVKHLGKCWVWKGGKNLPPCLPYGRVKIGGVEHKAHRVSFDLSGGKIKPGELVCHHCDNPTCVNPKHLFTGTHLDNALDMVKKKRYSENRGKYKSGFGTSNANSKLTDESVRKIISMYIPFKFGATRISKLFNVSKFAILCVLNGKTWSHVTR